MQNKEHKITKESLKLLRGESSQDRVLHRLHSVALVSRGYSSSEAARIYEDSPRAVAYWVKRFKADGIEGLKEESRPGRPSKLNVKQFKQLQGFTRRAKKNSLLNSQILSAYILEEFKISLTPRQCWRILKRLTS